MAHTESLVWRETAFIPARARSASHSINESTPHCTTPKVHRTTIHTNKQTNTHMRAHACTTHTYIDERHKRTGRSGNVLPVHFLQQVRAVHQRRRRDRGGGGGRRTAGRTAAAARVVEQLGTQPRQDGIVLIVQSQIGSQSLSSSELFISSASTTVRLLLFVNCKLFVFLSL
jgi:hypothetical protein